MTVFAVRPELARQAYARVGAKPSPVALASKDAGDGVFQIDMLDFIGEDMFGAGITPRGVASELDSMPAGTETVRLRINSPGGSATDGAAIRSILRATAKEKGVKVVAEIHGLAASAATMIAMAGDEILMAPDALFMVHNPWTFAYGDSNALRSTAAVLEKHEDAYAKAYADRTGLPEADVRELMSEETWMDSDDAIGFGFATGTLSESSEPVAAAQNERIAAAHASLGLPYAVPHEWTRAFVAEMSAKTQPKAKRETMNPKILAALGLESDAKPEAVLSAIEAKDARITELESTVAQAGKDLEAAKADGAAAREQISAELGFEHSIALAEASGKLTPVKAAQIKERYADAREAGPGALAFFMKHTSKDLEDLNPSELDKPLDGPKASELEEPAGDPAFERYLAKHGGDLTETAIANAREQK